MLSRLTVGHSTRARHGIRMLLLGATALVAGASSAHAQTRFEWPASPAALEEYGTPEECLAAVDRIRARAQWGMRDDTLSLADRDRGAEPSSVIAAAGRCGSHLTGERLPGVSRPLFLKLLLIAGRDSAFEAAVGRQLAEVHSVAERGAVLGAAAQQSLSVRPARLALAETLVHRLDSLGPAAARPRMEAYFHLTYLARRLRDSVLLARTAPRALAAAALFDSASPSLLIKSAMAAGKMELGRPRPIDVLRESGPDAYVQFIRSQYTSSLVAQGLGRDSAARIAETDAVRGAGGPARPLVGEYWYGRGNRAGPLPAPGRVSLVVFVDHRCGARCYPGYAMLKRLGRRFGDSLDVILVAQTFGYFRLRPPPSPAEEAEAMRHYFLEELQLPGVLNVAVTPFTQLPAPDGRFIYDATPNDANYGVSPRWTEQWNVMFVVGPTGTILYKRDVRLEVEREVTDIIAAAIDYQEKCGSESTGMEN